MESTLCSEAKLKLGAVSFMKHTGTTSTDFECPATDAAAFQADTTQIEPSPVLQTCVHVFVI
jgi:hypothetical protein